MQTVLPLLDTHLDGDRPLTFPLTDATAPRGALVPPDRFERIASGAASEADVAATIETGLRVFDAGHYGPDLLDCVQCWRTLGRAGRIDGSRSVLFAYHRRSRAPGWLGEPLGQGHTHRLSASLVAALSAFPTKDQATLVRLVLEALAATLNTRASDYERVATWVGSIVGVADYLVQCVPSSRELEATLLRVAREPGRDYHTRMRQTLVRLALTWSPQYVQHAVYGPELRGWASRARDFAPLFYAGLAVAGPADAFRAAFRRLSRREPSAAIVALRRASPDARLRLTTVDLRPLLASDDADVRLAAVEAMATIAAPSPETPAPRPARPRRTPRTHGAA